MSLTHDWFAGVDGQGRWYIHGGQPDDEGRHPYVIHVQDGEDGDIAKAAEQIAAALRGEG